MKRMIPILMVMTLFLTGCAVSTPAPEANTYSQITMQEAVEMMEKEETTSSSMCVLKRSSPRDIFRAQL